MSAVFKPYAPTFFDFIDWGLHPYTRRFHFPCAPGRACSIHTVVMQADSLSLFCQFQRHHVTRERTDPMFVQLMTIAPYSAVLWEDATWQGTDCHQIDWAARP